MGDAQHWIVLAEPALGHGVGRIVVDSFSEINRLAALATGGVRPRLMVRATPGVDPHTHAAMATGTDDQKFGFSLASGAAAEAVRRVLAQRGLELAGLHCHIGSQVADMTAFERAAVGAACRERRLPVPRITVEPGRAIVARAGVTVYRVVSVKHGASGDVLVHDVPLPADVRAGDLLAVPCTGAYHHSMASNYDLVRRPPVVAVRDGRVRVLVRRETEEDLLRRDVG
ncbi:hypothetical protein F9B16_00220 [Actinomadura montaniterrae]|uniref:Orn/DAP/Arg decarboxylase 2 N-terminal domain-containing protein n=1 Tax=Actinomadura montaniterrae TaxID=1803903 RepID=A0A6L3W5P9_9ACTN|nr:hypothetical protein F9B16_00220 [Actinomadura montaniterrae]